MLRNEFGIAGRRSRPPRPVVGLGARRLRRQRRRRRHHGDRPGQAALPTLAWQEESVAGQQGTRRQVEREHPDIQVEYVQGDWNSVHDQLLTSFEGGEAPDIIHTRPPTIAEFTQAGLPGRPHGPAARPPQGRDRPGRLGHRHLRRRGLRRAVPAGVAGRHRQQEAARRGRRGVPTADAPWTWDEFQANAQKLTKAGTVRRRLGAQVADEPGDEPVAQLRRQVLLPTAKTEVKVGDAEKEVPQRIHDMIYTAKTRRARRARHGRRRHPARLLRRQVRDAARLGVYLRQQMVEQAPRASSG